MNPDDGPPATPSTPLLHLAATERERDDRHTYLGDDALGVRTDMVQALERTLTERLPKMRSAPRRDLAVQLGLTACLVLAPRTL
ncbi:hypothetical protein ACF06W_11390 [Streptomyces albus]|uniref:hypothetical protein n=1 Tax=Streptomyces albus TaxID=1888 RepID=UPI0036FEE5EE